MITDTSYRAEIDGLRALAVVGVVLFHAQFDALPGGFAGVDVFFVISGYLITRIILAHDGTVGEFLLNFYERRIRRLIPPILPVLMFVAIGGWLLLPAEALRELAESLLSFLAFISNWYFLQNAGYFDGPSELKPLLHTLSLSIEEQFYLLFPFPILLLRNRFGRHTVRWLLCIVFVLSFAYGAYLVAQERADAAFYNSFARFWELCIGAILAATPFRLTNTAVRHVTGICGLGLIFLSFLLFNEEMPFPGWMALLPTIGTAMVIAAPGSITSRILGMAPIVGLGLISYALYLWHWPVFVFIDYAIIAPTAAHFGVGIAVSTGLAAASFFIIEDPIRKRRAFAGRKPLGFSYATSTALFVALGVSAVSANGFPSRFPAAVEYETMLPDLLREQRTAADRPRCWVGGTEDMEPVFARCLDPAAGQLDVLLVGDSHAAQFRHGIATHWPEANLDLLASDSCALQRGFRDACDQIIEWLLSERVAAYDLVIISVWGQRRDRAEGTADLALKLAQAVPVTMLGPVQFYQPNLPTLYPLNVGRYAPEDLDRLLATAVQPEQFDIDDFLEQHFRGTAVSYVSLLDMTCPDGPQSCTNLDPDNLPVTVDNSHLSRAYAEILVEDFLPLVSTLRN